MNRENKRKAPFEKGGKRSTQSCFQRRLFRSLQRELRWTRPRWDQRTTTPSRRLSLIICLSALADRLHRGERLLI